MTLGFIFWLFMLLWLVFGFWSFWPRAGTPATVWPVAGGLGFVWVLFLLLGIQVFGWPIKA